MPLIFKKKLIPYTVPEVNLQGSFSSLKYFLSEKSHQGKEIEIFEKEFAHFIDVPYAIIFPSARYALYLLYTFFNCKNKRVIVPAYTCIPAIDAVKWAGGLPFFVDIELNTYNPVFNQKLEKLNNIGALCLSYLYGLIGDHVEEFIDFSQSQNIPIIEDAAIALGGSLHGKKIGGLGDAAVFSLQSSKIITGWKGGMVTTHRKDIYEYLLKERTKLPLPSLSKVLFNVVATYCRTFCSKPTLYGYTLYPIKSMISSKLFSKSISFLINQNPTEALTGESEPFLPSYEKVQFTPLQALMARHSFKNIDTLLKKRVFNAHCLIKGLEGQSNIVLPKEKNGRKHTYGRFPVRVPGKSKFNLQKLFLKEGIEIALNYPYICAPSHTEFPNASLASKETFLLPFHTFMSKKDIADTIHVLKTLSL